MKILHVVPTYLPATRYGGPIHSVHGLCRGLAQLGHQVAVFTTSVDGKIDSAVPLGKDVMLEGVRIQYFQSKQMRRLYYSPSLGVALGGNIGSFDIVHLHSVFLWPTLKAAREATKHQVPYVVSPRGMLVKELFRKKGLIRKSVWIKLFEKNTLQNSSFVHFTSVREKLDFEDFNIDVSTKVVIPNGIDTGEYLRREHAQNNILYLGRINWKKGLDLLLDALTYIPDAKLRIVGPDEEGYSEILKRGISDGLANRVEFIGPTYGKEKNGLLARAGVLVLPSISENFGNVVIEAMAAGCPVVVTPDVGAAEIVRKAQCGKVAERNPAAIAEAIKACLENRRKNREMGSAGQRYVEENLTWKKIASEMVDHYQHVLDTKG